VGFAESTPPQGTFVRAMERVCVGQLSKPPSASVSLNKESCLSRLPTTHEASSHEAH